jgi:type II secretory pathway component PulJ
MLTRNASRARQVRGFSLVELMVALVAGLVVVGAVLALVASIMQSNRETLQSTRLNQELRATLAVIANDLRRARSVEDPLTVAVSAGGNPFAAVSTSTAGCIVYAYEGALDGPWHLIKMDSGAVVLQGTTTRPASCSPSGSPVRLGSEQVEITALTFSPTTTTGTPPQPTDESLVRELTVSVTGHLIDPNSGLAGISRTVSQTVYVRSVGTGI